MLKSSQVPMQRLSLIVVSVLLSLSLAYLISRGEWIFALVVAVLAPLAVILSEHPFIGPIMWLLLLPILSALPSADLLYWALHRILLPMSLIIAFLPYFLKKFNISQLKIGPPEFSIAVFALIVPISILIRQSYTQDLLIKYLDRVLIPFSMYFIVRLIKFDEWDQKILKWTVFIVSITQIVIGFISWVLPSFLPYDWRYLAGARTAGSLYDPAVFTSVLVFCATYMIFSAMQYRPGFKRFLFLMVSSLCFFSVFMSLERGSWLGGVLVLFGLFILYPRTLRRFIFILLMLIIIIGSVFFSNYKSHITARLIDQGPIDDRIVVTDAMIQMSLEKPFLGWGFETLDQNIIYFYRQVGSASIGPKVITSHNTYFTIMSELGFVGFILYIFPIFWLCLRSVPIYRGIIKMETKKKLLLSAFWLSALHYLIVSNFIDMRFFPIGITLWWMNLALIANLISHYGKIEYIPIKKFEISPLS